MNTIIDLTSTTVEIAGMKFSLTMDDLAMIQSMVPLPDELRPFVGMNDLLRFCQSPQGIPVALLQAGKKFDSELTIAKIYDNITVIDSIEVVATLINKCMGVQPSDAKEEGKPHAPLAVKSETGF